METYHVFLYEKGKFNNVYVSIRNSKNKNIPDEEQYSLF